MVSTMVVSKAMYTTEALKRVVDMEVWCLLLTLMLLTATFQGNQRPEAERKIVICSCSNKQISSAGKNWIPDSNLEEWYHNSPNELSMNGGKSIDVEVDGNALMLWAPPGEA